MKNDEKVMQQVVRELRSHGLDVDADSLDVFGTLNRCPLIDKSTGKDGAYLVHMDDPVSIWWENHVTGDTGTWSAENTGTMTTADREAMKTRLQTNRAERDAARARQHEERALVARDIYAQASLKNVDKHPYAARKRLDSGLLVRRGVFADNDCLIVPLYGQDGHIWSIQAIAAEKVFDASRDKTLLAGARKAGCFCPVGPTFRNAPKVCIAEGLATAAAIHDATGLPVVMAVDAGNMLAVGRVVRELAASGAEIIFCADDDMSGDAKANTGIEAATKAALAIGGRVATPDMGKKADFWDLLMEVGSEAVRERIGSAQAVRANTQGLNDQKQKDATQVIPDPGHSLWPEFVPFDETPPDLPQGIVPGLMGLFAEAVAEAIQAPRELAVFNVLGVVALAVQQKVIVRVKADYAEGVNLYAITASEPGERKSAVVEACKRPIVKWEREAQELAREEIRDILSERQTFQKMIDRARTRAASAQDAEARKKACREIAELEREMPDPPNMPRLLADDCTPEAMAVILSGNGENLGILEAEGGLLDTWAGRYASGIPNLDLVLKGYGAEAVTVDRKGKDPIMLKKPRLTVVLTPQPMVLIKAGGNQAFMDRGLIGRCMLCMPRTLVGYRDSSKTMNMDIANAWNAFVRSLLEMPMFGHIHELSLDPVAYDLWLDFAQEIETAQRPGGDFEFVRAWASKSTGHVIRVAGIFHMAAGPAAIHNPIDVTTMQRATAFVAWAAKHARYCFGRFGDGTGQGCANRILEWLQDKRLKTVTARAILQALKGKYPNMAALRPGISMLVDRGALVPQDTPNKVGRPSVTFAINPAIYGVDEHVA